MQAKTADGDDTDRTGSLARRLSGPCPMGCQTPFIQTRQDGGRADG